jgi:hexosaminidase
MLGTIASALLASPIAIIPQPVSMQTADGSFMLTSKTVIVASKSEESLAMHMRDWLKPALGFSLEVRPKKTANAIELGLDKRLEDLGQEGYTLFVDGEGVHLRAFAEPGLFYGFQSLRQILPSDIYRKSSLRSEWQIPFVAIRDYPRFGWRGSHIDVARHFMPKEFVLKYIDLISMHKMNTLHMHLTDDQGWRIEIKKYPKLTEIGGANDHSARLAPGSDGEEHPDSLPTGGYFTQDDIREIVAYAADRYVTVVPEIEMPGHSQAAIASYPELGNTGKPISLMTTWGVSENVYNVEDSTIRFLQDVLDEVMQLFPSKFIHVGGDEVPKNQWKVSASAQSRIRTLGLKNEDELQSWFIRQMDTYLTSKGRRLIGWDEILQGGLAPGATVMSWRGEAGGIEAAKSGHDVVMAPNDWTYFDHYQSRFREQEPLANGGYLPLKSVYAYEPVPASLSPQEAKHVMGAQCQLWSEYIPHPKQMEYMAFPRACALAEVVWSRKEQREYDGFLARLAPHLDRLKVLDVNFRKVDKDNQISVGSWQSGEISEQFTAREWDITQHVKDAGVYVAYFSYSGGACRLDIEWSELLENGVPISRDSHKGTTGGDDKGNEYVVQVYTFKPDAKYVLRASVRSDGGTDSNGDIFLFKKK